jgi:hypothetical protein
VFSDALELRLHLPGTEWPLAVDHAELTWSRWNTVTVEFRAAPPLLSRRPIIADGVIREHRPP